MTAARAYSRSIGDFLTRHEVRSVERIDDPQSIDFDVRQSAATRTFAELSRRGLLDGAFADTLNQYPEIAGSMLKFARIDAWRRLKGRPSLERSLNDEDEFADNRSERALEHVEVSNDLHLLYETCTPIQQEAIQLMVKLQHAKSLGHAVSHADRMKLVRLRKATGWALKPTLL